MGFVLIAASAPIVFPWGLVVTLTLWGVILLLSLNMASAIVLRRVLAVDPQQAEYRRLFNIVEETAIASGLGVMPRLLVIDDPAANAFAIGRRPEFSTIAVTIGLVRTLKRDELQGVIAHETAHIKNHDVGFMTFAAAILGVVVAVSELTEAAIRGCLRIIEYGCDRSSQSFSPWILVMVLYAVYGVVIFLAVLPFFLLGQLLQRILYFACSRKREFLADACAVQYTRYPEGLASALEKISSTNARPSCANAATAPLFIIDPIATCLRRRFEILFTTHPPTSERIRVLRGMAGSTLTDYEASYREVKGKDLTTKGGTWITPLLSPMRSPSEKQFPIS